MRLQVTRSKFVLLWATYLTVMYGGLQAGIGTGIVFSTLYFDYFAEAKLIRHPSRCSCVYASLSPLCACRSHAASSCCCGRHTWL